MDYKIQALLKKAILYSFCIWLGPKCTLYSANTSVDDTVFVKLQNIDIVADKIQTNFHSSTSDGIVLNNELFKIMPKVLGNADPTRIIQYLPGVQTNTESKSGISIYGTEPQHTGIFVDRVPVYGVSHMIGIFSLFNPLHFSKFSLNYNVFNSGCNNFLGGELNAETSSDIPEKTFGFDAEIGLISTQASFELKVGNRTNIILSARKSYLNLLYGNLLNISDINLKYDFGDYNLTVLSKPSDKDLLRFSAYYGNDDSKLRYASYSSTFSIMWKNMFAQMFHQHSFSRFSLTNNLYYTAYNSNGNCKEINSIYNIKSHTKEIGYNLNLDFRLLTAGIRIQHFINLPQEIYYESDNNLFIPASASTLYSMYTEFKYNFNEYWDIKAMLEGGMFSCNKNYFNIDPGITLTFCKNTIGLFELGLGHKTQPLSRVGMTDTNLGVDYYLSPEEVGMAPQHAVGINLLYSKELCNNLFNIEIRSFYKRIYNQIEYRGNLFELLNTQNTDNCLLKGKGYSYGGSVMLQKNKGKFNGWISYSYTHAQRTFQNQGYSEFYPAAGERPHELNVVTSYTFNKNWNANACFVLASGEPFTPVKQLYLINGRIVPEMGKHNSDRMKAYMRLDLTVNYNFNTKGNYRHGISFSLYNATKHSNPMSIFFDAKPDDDSTLKGKYNFTYFNRIIPSISYFLSL